MSGASTYSSARMPIALAEQEPERVRARLEKVLAPHPFELEWVSVYTFNCRRLDRFVHGRVIFIGDAAHQVSPFGARGANSGIQDAENLAWKLAAVLNGEGGEALIESYEVERIQAADENIGHSTRSTDFMSPHSSAERRLARCGAGACAQGRIRPPHGQFRPAFGADSL